MLTYQQVASYLLQCELIDPASIVAGDLIVEDASRRNHNFKVISERGPCYLLKQGIGPEGIATLAREAAMYEYLLSDGGQNGIDNYLPRYYGYDEQEHILILELVRAAEDLRAHHARRGRFSTTLAKALGDALSTLHRLAIPYDHKFAQPPPWALSAYYLDLDLLQNISSANLKIIETIQRSSEFCQLLNELRGSWRAETLTHYDIKWDNCVVPAQLTSKRKPSLKIVDWEFAGVGDPCWDIGSVFSNYLSFWLLSIPITGDAPPDRFMDLARYPLEHMQPAIRTFWDSYVRRMEVDTTTVDRWLMRAIRYAAARLIQTAFEQTQMGMYLTGNIVCLLQLSLNILRGPQEAIVTLLGIPLGHKRPA